jgi:hypothetical protein
MITTLITFATAANVMISELAVEAFLPADDATARLLIASGAASAVTSRDR